MWHDGSRSVGEVETIEVVRWLYKILRERMYGDDCCAITIFAECIRVNACIPGSRGHHDLVTRMEFEVKVSVDSIGVFIIRSRAGRRRDLQVGTFGHRGQVEMVAERQGRARSRTIMHAGME